MCMGVFCFLELAQYLTTSIDDARDALTQLLQLAALRFSQQLAEV